MLLLMMFMGLAVGLGVTVLVAGTLSVMLPGDISEYLKPETKDKYYTLPTQGGETTSVAFRPTQYKKEIM